MRRAFFVVVLALASCADSRELLRRGTDPDVPREERVHSLHDALGSRDPGVAQDLVARAEGLLASTGPPAEVARDRACALDAIDALVRTPESTAPLTVSLSSQDSPLVRSKPALERLGKHPDAGVRDLAGKNLSRLK